MDSSLSLCSINTGPKQMARFCVVILFLSDWLATSRRWSMRRNNVIWKEQESGCCLDTLQEAA